MAHRHVWTSTQRSSIFEKAFVLSGYSVRTDVVPSTTQSKIVRCTICPCCGIKQIDDGVGGFEVGHIVAFAKGGGDTVDNVLPICGSCNLTMGTKPIYEFMTALGRCEKYHELMYATTTTLEFV